MAATIAVPRPRAASPTWVKMALAQELAARGIPILPLQRVKEHKNHTLAEDVILARRRARRDVHRRIASLAALWLGCTATVAGGGLLLFFGTVTSLLAMIFVAAVAVSAAVLMVVSGIELPTTYAQQFNFWMHGTAWLKVPYEHYHSPVPERVCSRAQGALEIPDTTLQVEWFKSDPFLIVQRGDEHHYIAAWGTGTELDEI